MRVLIGICSGDHVHSDWAMAFASMMAYPMPGIEVSLFQAKGCHLDRNRYRCAQAAVKHGADALFILDTDIIFRPDLLKILVEHEVRVVGADYARRVHPHVGLAFDVEGKLIPYGSGLVEASLLPGGTLLIRTEVFGRIEPHHFHNHLSDDPDVFISGDWDFCYRVRQAGVRIYCDSDIEIRHIGQNIFYKEGVLPPYGN